MFRHRRLTPPSNLVFVVSLIIAVVAVVSVFYPIPVVGRYVSLHRFWVATGAYALLAAGVVLRGF